MRYTTKLFGAPYGMQGERGFDVTPERTPLWSAQKQLHPGQHMDCFTLEDEEQAQPVMRFRCDAQGQVGEVNI